MRNMDHDPVGRRFTIWPMVGSLPESDEKGSAESLLGSSSLWLMACSLPMIYTQPTKTNDLLGNPKFNHHEIISRLVSLDIQYHSGSVIFTVILETFLI